MKVKSRLIAAFKAFSIHLVISSFAVLIAAIVVFFVWFPLPYRDLAGGTTLFFLLVGVDVICGPLLTALVFNPKKSRKELSWDLSMVAILQIFALAYGLYSIGLARPVILAFEIDRFVVVSAAQVERESIDSAPLEYRSLSWNGPRLVGTRKPVDGTETLQSLDLSAQGLAPSARPGWWVEYENNRSNVVERMKKLSDIYSKLDVNQRNKIDAAVQETKTEIENISFLPLVSKNHLDQWVVLLNSNAEIIGYAPISGFQRDLI